MKYLAAICLALTTACAMKSQRSQGVLRANVGMTFDQVKAASTVPVNPRYYEFTHASKAISEIVFDYEIPNMGVRFEQCRYFWIDTASKSPIINTINIGINAKKLPPSEFNAFLEQVRARFTAAGWKAGHWVHGSETGPFGRYWAFENTLAIIEEKKVDDDGNSIVNLVITPRDGTLYKDIQY